MANHQLHSGAWAMFLVHRQWPWLGRRTEHIVAGLLCADESGEACQDGQLRQDGGKGQREEVSRAGTWAGQPLKC